jgi:hypothetical protein
MSPTPRRSPTPTPSRRPEDAPRPAPTKRPPVDLDDDRGTRHLPNAERRRLLMDGDRDLDEEAVEREAERVYGHVEGTGPGAWAYALKQANRRVRGA